jgi:hypothetical protein
MSNDETTTTTRGNEKDNQKLPQAFSRDRCSIRSGYSVVQKSNPRRLSLLDGAGLGVWERGLAGLFFLGYGGSLGQVTRIFITKLFPAARLDWVV